MRYSRRGRRERSPIRNFSTADGIVRFSLAETGVPTGRTATRGNIEKRHFDKQLKRKIMKLSELIDEMRHYLAHCGDVSLIVEYKDALGDVGHRSPCLEITDTDWDADEKFITL